MKKTTIFIFLMIFVLSASAQNKRFTINWVDAVNVSTSSIKVEVPGFNAENFSYSEEDGILYTNQWSVSSNFSPKSTTVSNIAYEVISTQNLKSLRKENLPSQPDFNISKATARGESFAVLRFSPII
ncbi:MAG: hypothetical protein V7767_11840, partial [Leeuwenhoekiella sp.]